MLLQKTSLITTEYFVRIDTVGQMLLDADRLEFSEGKVCFSAYSQQH
jgi:hypothetical protein